MRCGSRSSCCARRPTWPRKVALYITVWRAAGTWSAIVRMSSMKPMSSMRSASSSTSISTLSSTALPVCRWSSRRPGVAIRMSSGPRSAFSCARIGHAADDGGDAQARHVAAVGRRRLGDLQRELAGRRQHQHARAVDRALLAALRGVGARRQHALQRRQDERRGLAAAGGDGDHQVGAGERRRDRRGLHFGGRVVAGIGQGAGEGLGQAQGFETHGSLSVVERERRRLRAARSSDPDSWRVERSRSVLRIGCDGIAADLRRNVRHSRPRRSEGMNEIAARLQQGPGSLAASR